jgi:hypothetical protein
MHSSLCTDRHCLFSNLFQTAWCVEEVFLHHAVFVI